MSAVFAKFFEPWKRRIMLMIGRAIIHAATDQKGRMVLKLTALQAETLDGVELMQDYGFASRPLAGAEAVIASVMGERAGSVCVATEDKRYRPQDLKAGESILFDDQGQMVAIRRGYIEVISGQKVKVTAPSVEVIATDVTITATNINIDSSNLEFGGDGQTPAPAAARIGDQVQVGGQVGTIISGSAKMRVG